MADELLQDVAPGMVREVEDEALLVAVREFVQGIPALGRMQAVAVVIDTAGMGEIFDSDHRRAEVAQHRARERSEELAREVEDDDVRPAPGSCHPRKCYLDHSAIRSRVRSFDSTESGSGRPSHSR